MSILDISKTLIYEFWYDYIQQKNQNKAKLYCLNTESFIIYIKTEDFDKDIDVEKWFDTSNYNEYNKRPLPISMNKTVTELPKVELGGEIIKEFVTRRAKNSYLMDDESEYKNAKGTKKDVIKRMLKFKIYKNCYLNNKNYIKTTTKI